MRLASCASDDLLPKGAAEPPVATGQEYRAVSGGATGDNSLGTGLTATADAATPAAVTPAAASAGLGDGAGSRSIDQRSRAAHPVAFPAAPPYPEALLPRAVCGNLVGDWGPRATATARPEGGASVSSARDASAARDARDGGGAGAASALGGAAVQGTCDERMAPAAEHVAAREAATAGARGAVSATGAMHGQLAAVAQGAPTGAVAAAEGTFPQPDHRVARFHRGLTVASVALTVLACALLVAAAFAARSILLPLAVGLAVVALVVASRAAMGGALSSRAFRLAQFVLVVVALAGVVVMASELMGVVR